MKPISKSKRIKPKAIKKAPKGKSIDKNLIQKDSFAQKICNTAQVIILVLSKQGKIISFNPYFEGLTGYSINAMKGKDWFSNFIPKKDRDTIRKLFSKVVKGAQTKGGINSILTKRGNEVFIEWNDSILKDNSGDTIGVLSIGNDVSQKMLSEKHIKNLAKFPEENRNPVYRVSKDGVLLYANPASRRLISDNPTAVGNKVPGKWRKMLKDVYKSGKANMVELEFNEQIYSFMQVPILGADYINVYGYDITASKKAEDSLSRQHKQLLSMFDGMDEVIYVSDPETYELLYTNRVAKNIWGPGEGKKCYKVFQNRNKPCEFCTNHRIFGDFLGKTFIWEFQNNKNSRYYRCIDRAIRWSDGKMVRYEMAIDVTELKKSEIILRESEERYRFIVDNTTDFIALATFDVKATFLYVSPAYKANLGYDAEYFIGKSAFDFIHTDDKKNILPLIKKYVIEKARGLLIKTDKPIVETIECRLKDKAGKWHNMEVKVNIAGDKLIFVTRDVTERKKADDELQKAYVELKGAQAQLIQAEKMEVVGRMASGVAHEVKNPLGIILQGVNYFEAVLPTAQEDNKKMLKMMKDNVKRADNIVRALLDFSKVEELNAKQENINHILQDSLELTHYKIKSKGVEVIKELKIGLPELLVDRAKLEQVFINLFLNAIDVMPEGGKLYIRSYLSQLDKAGAKTGNRRTDLYELGEDVIIVEVEDTGTGISKENMHKIFDPFFTSKSRAEGTGLGLAIAKNIIAMHRSIINVESKEGKGTKFTIALKLSGRK